VNKERVTELELILHEADAEQVRIPHLELQHDGLTVGVPYVGVTAPGDDAVEFVTLDQVAVGEALAVHAHCLDSDVAGGFGMVMGTVMEVTPFLFLWRVVLFMGSGRARLLPKNAVLDQKHRRLSARSVFFRVRSSLAMEAYAVTYTPIPAGCFTVTLRA